MPKKPDTTIIGETFNNLQVIELTDQKNSYDRRLYRCKCLLCGGERLATKANLKRGEIKDCGCTKHNPKKSLVGETFGFLYVKDTRVVNNKIKYLCVCNKCGAETLVYPYDLKNGNTQSCGNHNKGEEAAIKKTFVDGTAPCKLVNTDKLRETNTSGVTGVYWNKARCMWEAEITFKNKKYHLGRFGDKEQAIAARRSAEERMFGEFLKNYEIQKENKEKEDE